jgi:hypothetical protein
LGQINLDWMGGLDVGGMEPAAAAAGPPVGSAAWVASQAGGVKPQAAGSAGTTVVNNFNQQLTRSDAVAIAAETGRQYNRQ